MNLMLTKMETMKNLGICLFVYEFARVQVGNKGPSLTENPH